MTNGDEAFECTNGQRRERERALNSDRDALENFNVGLIHGASDRGFFTRAAEWSDKTIDDLDRHLPCLDDNKLALARRTLRLLNHYADGMVGESPRGDRDAREVMTAQGQEITENISKILDPKPLLSLDEQREAALRESMGDEFYERWSGRR
jgi:hypothetical protein